MAKAAELESKTIPHLAVRELRPIEFGDAAALIGRGMCDNPSNVRVFAIHDKERRIGAMARFFRPVMQSLYERGLLWGAFRGGALAGVCGMARPGFCQPTAFDKLRLVPAVMLKNPGGTVLRVVRWTGEWARRDPTEPHWHLGPVAVDPLFQHQGIGSRMMSVFCACMDEFNAVAYLETDKSENVRFYQKFDFTVVAQADVLGIPNWFMLRHPRTATP
jgi:ribosomal protein S18 acetylase RimI-like enzyme